MPSTVAKVSPLKADPSRTFSLRRMFMAEFRRRFARLQREITRLVVTEDAFGIDPRRDPLTNSLIENRGEFAAVMARITQPPILSAIREIQERIDPKDLVELETDSHITVFYGLHDPGAERVTHILEQYRGVFATIKGLSLFENEVDVLKFDIESPVLHELHNHLKLFPYTETHKDYHPHLTVAYLKPGTGRKYLERTELDGVSLVLKSMVYSSPSREHTGIVLNDQRWKFRTNAEQLRLFEEWLKTEIQGEILQSQVDAYWEKYIEESYKKGLGRSFEEVNKGKKVGREKNLDFYKGSKSQFIQDSFHQPASIEKVKLLAGRVYTDLQGVTETMAAEIKRTLVDGMIQGRHPRVIAKQMNERVDKIGITRANTIARTEVMRAHAEGQLDAFDKMGVAQLGVSVEWSTAIANVCPLCAPLEGIVVSIKESRGMLPRHPNCRCVWLPAGVGETSKKQIKSKPEIDKAIDTSLRQEIPKKEKGKTSLREQSAKSKWGGARKRIAEDRPKSLLETIREGKSKGKTTPRTGAKDKKFSTKPINAEQAKTGKRVEVNGVKRDVYRVDGINYVKDTIPGDKDTVVIIADVAKLDKEWARSNPSLYIPKGGGGAEIGGRRAQFEKFIGEDPNRPIQMPRVGVLPEKSRFNPDAKPIVGFGNGRHRFSIIRDKYGRETIAIQVDRATVEEAKKLLSPDYILEQAKKAKPTPKPSRKAAKTPPKGKATPKPTPAPKAPRPSTKPLVSTPKTPKIPDKPANLPEVAKGGAVPKLTSQRLEQVKESLLATVRTHPDNAGLMSVKELKKQMGLTKEEFDEAALDLWRKWILALSEHPHVASLTPDEVFLLISDGKGRYFNGIAIRKPD